MIRVFIVEDLPEHQLFLQTIVKSSSELDCVGVAADGHSALRSIRKQAPDVVLMDIGLPDISGIECIQLLRGELPQTRFMVCTVHEEDENLFDALKAGAHSYMLKKSKPYQILDAIREVYEGMFPISSCIAGKMLHYLDFQRIETLHKGKAQKQTEYKLTSKEHQILIELAKGFSYQEVAESVSIAITTLKWHIYNIYRKLHADNRTEALNKYFQGRQI